MKYILQNLALSISIGTACLLNLSCEQKVALELDKRYSDVLTIMSKASCEGPNGKYSTIVHSAHKYVYFHQDYSYRNESFKSIVENGQGVVLDSSDLVLDTLSVQNNFFVRSHDFIRIALKPQEFFSDIVFEKKDRDRIVFRATDELGNGVKLHYSESPKRLNGFVILNPSDTSEQITISYKEWKVTSYGPIPQALEIDQGGNSLFTFQFDEININSKDFKGILPEKSRYDFILKEKDLIPEGTSFNVDQGLLYIGSIYKQKIIGLDNEGNESLAVASDQFGKFSPLGIFYESGTGKIWTCVAMAPIVNHDNKGDWETTILSFSAKSGTLIKEYRRLASSGPILFNDLTVTEDGTVYATESMHNRVYRITEKADSLELFHELTNATFPNGITHKNDNLFIATDQGIVKLNVRTKNAMLLEANDGVDATVIDGLEITDDCFIGHQSTKVTRFFFDDNIRTLTRSEVLDDGEELDSSTTGVVFNGDYFFIVNSQLKSGIVQSTRRMKPLDSLEKIIIRRLKL